MFFFCGFQPEAGKAKVSAELHRLQLLGDGSYVILWAQT